MGINVAWITETGEPKQEILDPRQCLTGLAAGRWSELAHTMCLQFVDAWGDTVFNQTQLPHLLEELRTELLKANEPEVQMHLGKVVQLVERAADQMHTYVKFIGD